MVAIVMFSIIFYVLGLFHGIILESGSVLNPWAFTEQPKYQAFRLGKILGFNGTSEDNLGQYLLSIPAEELMWAQHKIINYGVIIRTDIVISFY